MEQFDSLSGLALVYAVVFTVKFFKRRKEDARRQFYDMVEEIMGECVSNGKKLYNVGTKS